MRTEKKFVTEEYLKRLNGSPFVLLVDYKGLTVGQFTEFRKRLNKANAEAHVVKNTIFSVAFAEAGLGKLGDDLKGQIAVVTGQKDISSAAKVVKTFQAEFDKPKLKFGFLGNRRLEGAEVLAIADLPSLEVLRAKLLGLFQTPASQLARVIGTPASQLARVIKAKADKADKAE